MYMLHLDPPHDPEYSFRFIRIESIAPLLKGCHLEIRTGIEPAEFNPLRIEFHPVRI